MGEPIDVPELAADGLLLRPWTDDDIGAVLELGRDQDVHRWTGTPQPFQTAQVRAFLDRRRSGAAGAAASGQGRPSGR